MAFGGSATISKLLGCEAGQEKFGVGGLIRITFLRDLKVAEAAEDELARTCCSFVMSQCRYRREL